MSQSVANAAFCEKHKTSAKHEMGGGGEGIKSLLPVHSPLFWLFCPQILTDRGDVKRINQSTIDYSKIVWLPEKPITA